jgi:hypothetical protein
LSRTPSTNGLHHYFLNLSGYRPGVFGESHAWGFFGAPDKATAKALAKQTLLQGHASIHKDDLYNVDDCLRIAHIGDWHIRVIPDPHATGSVITNGYFPLPKAIIDAWIARRNPY